MTSIYLVLGARRGPPHGLNPPKQLARRGKIPKRTRSGRISNARIPTEGEFFVSKILALFAELCRGGFVVEKCEPYERR
jgi:hypothetical protein